MSKKIKYIVRVLVFGVLVVGLLVSSSCYAVKFWEKNEYDFANYAILETLYSAARNCVYNGDWNTQIAKLSDDPDRGFEAFQNYVDLHAEALFKEGGVGQMASTLLEEKLSRLQDESSGGAHDGLVNCNDEVNKIDEIVDLLEFSGGSGNGNYTADTVENLICSNQNNGKEHGLLKITAGWRNADGVLLTKDAPLYDTDGNPALETLDGHVITSAEDPLWWPDGLDGSGSDCKGNLRLFERYKSRLSETMATLKMRKTGVEYKFGIKAEPNRDSPIYQYNVAYNPINQIASNGFEYFDYRMKDLMGGPYKEPDATLGRFDNGHGYTWWSNYARSYWKIYETFNNDETCADIGSGQIDAPYESTSGYVGIYDPSDQYVHFLHETKLHKDDRKWIFLDGQEIYNNPPTPSNNSAHVYPGSYELSCGAMVMTLGSSTTSTLPTHSHLKMVVIASDIRNVMGCIENANRTLSDYREYAESYGAFTDKAVYFVETVKDIYDGLLAFMSGNTDSSLLGIGTHVEDAGNILGELESWLGDISYGIGGKPVFANEAFGSLHDKVSEILGYVETDGDGHIVSITDDLTDEKMSELLEIWEVINANVQEVKAAREAMDSLLAEYSGDSDFDKSDWQNLENTVWGVDVYPNNLDARGNKAKSRVTCPYVDLFREKINAIQDEHPYFPGLPSINEWVPEEPAEPVWTIESEVEADACYSVAGAFGYWECEVVDQLAATVDGMDTILDQWLTVDSGLVDRSSTAYEVWKIFRALGNIAIVIVLLVIIFSQLTGVGIDNYGIKKILPKLIMVAILINLSHVICELAVDVSNLLGNGLNRMFTSMATAAGGTTGHFMKDAIAVVFGAVAGGGAMAGSVLGIVMASGGDNKAVFIVMIIMALLPVVVAVLLFFAAIGARMAIVILFTAISPLAVVLYALPNTQGIFKKYISVFKAALVVYPICGAMYGLGFVIRGILGGADTGGFGGWLISVVAPYLSFFALPALTKGALAGLSMIGGALVSVGSGIRSGIGKGTSAVQQSEMFKTALEDSREQSGYKRANRFVKRMKEKKQDKGKTLSAYQQRKMARAQDTIRAYDAKARDVKFKNRLGYGDIRDAEEFEKDVANETRYLNSATSNGAITEGQQGLYSLYKKYVESGDKAGAVAVARMASRRADTAGKFLRYVKENGRTLAGEDGSSDQRKAFDATMKEISEGANSASYRQADALGFEWASQLNRGADTANIDYGRDEKNSWIKQKGNITAALNNHASDGDSLMKLQKSSMIELNELMSKKGMEESDAERVRALAAERIGDEQHRNTLTYDAEKAKEFAKMSGVYEFDGRYVPKSPVISSSGNGTAAVEGQTYSTGTGSATAAAVGREAIDQNISTGAGMDYGSE